MQKRFKIYLVPLEIKILGVLRLLGRGVCFDDIEELTFVSAETHRRFFLRFIDLFASQLYDDWIFGPTTDQDILDGMA